MMYNWYPRKERKRMDKIHIYIFEEIIDKNFQN